MNDPTRDVDQNLETAPAKDVADVRGPRTENEPAAQSPDPATETANGRSLETARNAEADLRAPNVGEIATVAPNAAAVKTETRGIRTSRRSPRRKLTTTSTANIRSSKSRKTGNRCELLTITTEVTKTKNIRESVQKRRKKSRSKTFEIIVYSAHLQCRFFFFLNLLFCNIFWGVLGSRLGLVCRKFPPSIRN